MIETYKLGNGMQIVLEENHASKVVSFNVLVRVGSFNESDKEAGISHVIEHMLFKGTPRRPTGSIARDVEASGGEINAFTSMDQTVYYINMATRYSMRGLEILADAVQNPLFDETELEREKEVILEEIRRDEDNPQRKLTEHLFSTSFARHNYRRPIIGFTNTVKSFSRNDLINYHKRWYTPENMALIAVGDFDSKKLLKSIKGYFGNFRGRKLTNIKYEEESTQNTIRINVTEMNVQSSYLSISFHIPALKHEDVPALDALAHILGGTDSSRMEQEIKEKKKLVHNIYSYSYTPKHPGLFVIGIMANDKDVIPALRAITKEVDRVKTEAVTSEELSRAKLMIRSAEVYEKETVGGQASKIVQFVSAAGDHEFEARYYQMLSTVSTKDVLNVANTYLNFANANIVAVVPKGSCLGKSKDKVKHAITSIKSEGASRAKPLIKHDPTRTMLANGTTLITLENHNLPLVSICSTTLGGTRYENAANNGIYTLYSRTLIKGTKNRSAVQIAKDVEGFAGHIDGFNGKNTVGLKSNFLSEHIHSGMDLFFDVLTHPAFKPDEIAKEKKFIMQAIKDQEDQLTQLAFSEFARKLFPTHPYGLRLIGTKQSVKKLNRDTLIKIHRSTLKAKDLVIAVVGDFCTKEVTALINDYLKDVPKGRQKLPSIVLDPRQHNIREVTINKKEKQQSHIVLGFQGTTLKSADRYALSVLNNILSGQGGRLFMNLRDKLGLAYSVNSINMEGIEPGYFSVYIGTEPSKEKKAVDGILDELTRISSTSVTDEEIERSKQYIVGTYELDLQRNDSLASMYALNEVYDLGIKEIELYPQKILAVTKHDVLHVAQKYIKPNAYTIAIVRPEKQ